MAFRQKEKPVLVGLLVYSSFRRAATNMLRRSSVLTSDGSQISQVELEWGVNMNSLRIQFSTTEQSRGWYDCDVTVLVAAERVRNKVLLPKSYTLIYTHTAGW